MEELEKYIGSNKTYYINAYGKFKATGKCPFNFSACFFGVLWMLYRKMYIEAIVTSLIISCIELLMSGAIITILCAIVIGYTGNKLYIRKLERLQKNRKDYKAGGTNVLIVILVLIIPILLIKVLSQI